MTGGKAGGVNLIEADADGHDLGGAVGVVADEGEVELHGQPARLAADEA